MWGSFLGTKGSLFIDQGNRNLLTEFLRKKSGDAPLLQTLSSEVVTSEKSSLNLWVELMSLLWVLTESLHISPTLVFSRLY